MILSNLANLYRKLPTNALLKILVEQHKYDADAIQAVHDELAARDLSATAITKSKAQLTKRMVLEQQQVLNKEEQAHVLKTKVAQKFQFLNPFQQGLPLADRYVRTVLLLLAILLCMALVETMNILVQTQSTHLEETLLYLLLQNVLYIFLFFVAILFYKRIPLGWILLVITGFSLLLGSIVGFWYYTTNFYNFSIDQHFSEILYLIPSLFHMFMYAAVLYLALQPVVYKQFKLSNKQVYLISGLSALAGSFLIYRTVGSWFLQFFGI